MARRNKQRAPGDKWTASGEIQRQEKLLPKKRHEPGGPRTLVIDGHNLAYAAYYAYSKLTYKGKSVSIMYGMPQMVKSLINYHKPVKVIICWDGDKNPLRIEWLPTYKAHREEKRDPKQRRAFLKQIDRTQKLFYLLGIPQAYSEDVEGDDMIYMVTKTEKIFNRVIIVSGDKDLNQLIDHDVSVFHPIKKTPQGTFAFSAHNAVELWQYVDYLCLLGDTTDDIPGIRGIGPARAAAFLRQYNSIKEYLDDEDAVFTGMIDKDKVKKIIKRNRRMIDLKLFYNKFSGKPPITYIKDKKFPRVREEKFRAMCMRWNLKTMNTETFLKSFKELQ